MKEITKFLAWVLLSIPSLKRRKATFTGHRWMNGGLEPGAAPTYEVKFKVY